MTALDRTIDALQRAVNEHGFPNGFSSEWLAEVEGGVTRRQANRAGRDFFRHGATLRVDINDACYVTYSNGHFEVSDPTPWKCCCQTTTCRCGAKNHPRPHH